MSGGAYFGSGKEEEKACYFFQEMTSGKEE